MPNVLRNLKVNEIAFCKQGAGKGVRITLFKSKNGETMELKDVLAGLPEDQRSIVQAALDAKPKDEPSDEDTLKNLPEEVQKRLSAQDEELKKAREEAKANADKVAKLEEASVKKAYLEKASGLSHFPSLKAEQLAKVLRAVDEHCDEETSKAAAEAFTAVSETVKKSELLKARGKSQPGVPGEAGDSAMGQLEAIAKGLQEKNSDLSSAQAFAKACEQNPGLYRTHVEERL